MRTVFAAIICTLILPCAGFAKDVSLTLLDGSLTVSGELKSFDGAFYSIQSPYGPLTFAADSVTCDGSACPDVSTYAVDLRISVEDGLDVEILKPLIRGFAASQLLTAQFEDAGDQTNVTIHKRNGPRIAALTMAPVMEGTDLNVSLQMNDDADMDHVVIGWIQNPDITSDMSPFPSVCRDDGTQSAAMPNRIPVYLGYKAQNADHIVTDIKRFILSVPGQRILSRTGIYTRANAIGDPLETAEFVQRGLLNATDDTELKNVTRVLRRLEGYTRIDLSFQFKPDTQDLDTLSITNLDYVADLLLQGGFKDKAVIFAGFTDGSGPYDANLTLSLKRAKFVRDAVRMRMGSDAPPLTQFRARGFGETLPVACNDTAWGHQQNRRVEIWIKEDPVP
ncbi:MAG: OmpA family protein [Planktomarina sp.]